MKAITIFILNLIDVVFTLFWFLVYGGISESNPLMRVLLEYHPLTFIIFKLGLGLLLLGVFTKFAQLKVTQICATVGVVVYSYIAFFHLTMSYFYLNS